jgi:hypothetical protein
VHGLKLCPILGVAPTRTCEFGKGGTTIMSLSRSSFLKQTGTGSLVVLGSGSPPAELCGLDIPDLD